MTKDKDVLEETWKRNAKIMAETVQSGKNVVYLTVGDPFLYSTWIYMHKDLTEKYPEMNMSAICTFTTPETSRIFSKLTSLFLGNSR